MTYSNMNVSGDISNYINFVDDAVRMHKFCTEEMERLKKAETDILHKIELDILDKNEKCKVATALKRILKDRRYYKDRIEELTPVVNYHTSDFGKGILNNMRKVLGEVRKAEEYHSNRTYIPKELKNLEVRRDDV